MSACRENASIWFSLKGLFIGEPWRWKRLFCSPFWRSGYILHDSFGRYLNRWLLCRTLGHRYVKNIADPNETLHLHCFNCERRLNSPVTQKVVNDLIRKMKL